MNKLQAVAMRAKREAIRLRAWELYQNGRTQGEIAEVLGVVPSAVCKWVARASAGGRDALLSRVSPGPIAKLSTEQKALIPGVLMRGAESFGYRGDLWTRARIGEVIEREFGVRYSESQVARLLKEWGWSLQRPKKLASQRNEEAIAAWQEQHWPEVKKKAVREGWELVFVDESGFYLLPGVVRTWAPRGETPVLRARLTRDHVSVISGITPAGELYTTMQDHAFTSSDCVRFLKHLRRQIGRKIIVVWDGAPIHRSKVVKEYLATVGKGEVHLERFPPYAPELNPDEGIWRHLTYVELRNLCCETLEELKLEIRKAVARIRRRSSIVLACIAQPGIMTN